jgi:hypothetical protein
MSLGLGYQHDLRFLGDDRAHSINYVLKYATKLRDGLKLPPHTRRIAVSKKLGKRKKPSTGEFVLSEGVILMDLINANANQLIDIDKNDAVPIEAFESVPLYPPQEYFN